MFVPRAEPQPNVPWDSTGLEPHPLVIWGFLTLNEPVLILPSILDTEYPELERIHGNHQIQLLALHRTRPRIPPCAFQRKPHSWEISRRFSGG